MILLFLPFEFTPNISIFQRFFPASCKIFMFSEKIRCFIHSRVFVFLDAKGYIYKNIVLICLLKPLPPALPAGSSMK